MFQIYRFGSGCIWKGELRRSVNPHLIFVDEISFGGGDLIYGKLWGKPARTGPSGYWEYPGGSFSDCIYLGSL